MENKIDYICEREKNQYLKVLTSMKDTKQYILETSFKLFLNKTFKEVSMKELVDATGLSKGAFYHYFSGKEQLFREVIEQYVLRKKMSHYDTFDKSSLSAFYHAFLDYVQRERPSEKVEYKNINLVTLILEAIKLFPDLKESFHNANELELKIWSDVVASAKASGEINTVMDEKNVAQIFVYSKIAVGMRKSTGVEISTDKEMAEKLQGIWTDFYNELKS